MLKIRREQLEAMRAARAGEREPRMIEHARRSFPEECAEMSSGELRDFVRYASDKAAGYGIEGVAGACRYLNLMLLFGRDFDADCDWAAAVLASAEGETIQRLVVAARCSIERGGDLR